ncbi:TPA: DUF2264 domain-containing protein [Vibrio parahaemolyticus]|uniref:DUF2264 domain-containing protein n=1 Tax=Vibrio TaxID=662 RepID=UPI00084A9E7A|nr:MULTISPECIES: DUF2264 domain-containing protein [Vibrio]EJE8526012.1 DUF2264 domain-containing protein [Vibrio parahaemolyticus]ELS9504429.1 DUF2264 domain-containing protein [Vibrio parahaemolyticus]ODZ64938.1 hypothetical protein BBM44_07475 [Vibrio parahaemolyticus]RZQ41367.1 DUF2264 domain-containing protein [Vibrio vulnificus]HCH1649342.1 DUF2264 domain-containing protein [Vibrio parahaemolyticus]
MSKIITATPRPTIPYEHPDAAMYMKLFKENIIRLRHRKSAYQQHDDTIRKCFANEEASLRTLCESLVSYTAEAFEHYAVWDYSHAYYPGRPSQQTARTDAIEGVSRVLPTLATWLYTQDSDAPQLTGLNGKPIDVVGIIRSALLAGTDPHHKGYWGKLHDYDQRICESADLALTFWLTKSYIWQHLNPKQQLQIITWFEQVPPLKTLDNNWQLFTLTVSFVLKDLTGKEWVDAAKYDRIKEFYVGDGWFRDGANGNYDYYNVWGFFYSLYWIDQIDPDYDPQFIRQAMSEFVAGYRYFFTPQGLPLFGRSACYRLSAAVPLLAAIDYQSDAITIGQAKRAFKTNLQYFISNGALKSGAPTQGVFEDDARLVDNYSGPASSFWSLRALNLALYMGGRTGLWQAEEQPLEIEKGDFDFRLPAIDAHVIGTFKTKEVTVLFTTDYTQDQTPLSRRLLRQSLPNKVLEVISGRASRPKNNLLRKGITCYTSKMAHFF